jgi:hypothetical protein
LKKQRTAEQQNNPPSADRISKDGVALLSLLYITDKIPSFDIRYSLLRVSSFDQTGCLRQPAAGLTPDTFNLLPFTLHLKPCTIQYPASSIQHQETSYQHPYFASAALIARPILSSR